MTKFYATSVRDMIGQHLSSLPPKEVDRHSLKDMVAHWADDIARALTQGYTLIDVHAELIKHEAALCKFETFASYWRGLTRTADEQKKATKTTKVRAGQNASSPSAGTAPSASLALTGAPEGRVSPHAQPVPVQSGTPPALGRPLVETHAAARASAAPHRSGEAT
jgi:hypothetical protein